MALERRTPTGSESPSAARRSAIRLIVARNHTTSPDMAFAINVFRPSSESQAHTSRAFRARSSRSFASSGSASRMAAVRMVWNLDHGIAPRNPLIAASSSTQASQDNRRVCSATLRACQART